MTTAPQNYTEYLPNNIPLHMIFIKGGTFRMGTEDGYGVEKPVHQVRVPDFFMAKYPLTQVQWEAIMGDNPSTFPFKNHPVESVSWDDTQTFFEKLNAQTNSNYRLPTEAEWEYAARGGQSDGFLYAGSNKLKEVGWYDVNSRGSTQPVGLKLPNELGLYDMSGNVREWCADHWHDSYQGAPDDGSAWVDRKDERRRVVRGGSWNDYNDFCRVSNRFYVGSSGRDYYIGFRPTRY